MAERHLTYTWGTTDCMSTITDSLRKVGAKKSADKWERMIDKFRGHMDETTCGKLAIDKFGSIREALKFGLTKVGMIEVQYNGKRDMLLPYDIVFLEWLNLMCGWDMAVGVVDEDKNVLTWAGSKKTLEIVATPNIQTVMRYSVEGFDNTGTVEPHNDKERNAWRD